MFSTRKLSPYHLSRTQLMELDACTRCGECVTVCPATTETGNEYNSARGRIRLIKSYANAMYGPSAMLFGPKRKKADEILSNLVDYSYQCSVCGICKEVCEARIDTIELWEAFRAELVKLGKGPLPRHAGFTPRIKVKHNPYDELPENRPNWLPPDIKPVDKAEIGFFAGCTSSYKTKWFAVNFAKILDKFNVKFTYLGPEEYCCCSPLIRTGLLDIAKDTIVHNVESFAARGVQRVVTPCAGCFRTGTIDWPRFYGKRLPFEMVHATQFIAELIDSGRVKYVKKLDDVLTYHDPCHLGRHVGVFEEPRKILENLPIKGFIEMENNRSNSRCCGAGGGLKSGVPDLALNIAKRRVDEAIATKASMLTTSCPFCVVNFNDAIKAINTKLKLKDLIDLFAELTGAIPSSS
ncbi:MAG: (Fe-S)-binding protein [Candidatus Bathyarchaeota archaeon]